MTDECVQLVLGLVLAFPMAPDGRPDDMEMRSFVPSDPTCFGVRLQILVSDQADGAQDSFDVIVCTPKWLAWGPPGLSNRVVAGGPVMPGDGLWFVDSWDAEGIERTIRTLLSAATGPDWPHLANWFGRFAPWEFAYKFDEDAGVVVDGAKVYGQARPSE